MKRHEFQNQLDLDMRKLLNLCALDRNLQVFLGALSGLKHVASDDMGPTACTDGWTVWYHPDFWKKLTFPQRMGLIIHEMMHCMLLHMFRFRGAHHGIANVATDYRINAIIKSLSAVSSSIELPPDALDDEGRFKEEAEEIIYNKLLEEDRKSGGQGKGGGQGYGKSESSKGTGSSTGEFLPNDPTQKGKKGKDQQDPQNKPGQQAGGRPSDQELEEKWKEEANTAAQMAKLKGDFPGDVLGQLVPQEGRLDWKTILQQFIRGLVCDDVSEDTYDRRFLGDNIYVEAIQSPRVEGIVFVKDTSGSMCDEKTLTAMVSEIQQAVSDVKIPRIWVLDVDTRVYAEEFTSGETIPPTYKGGGGTDFRPAFDWVEDHFPDATAMVYFTDGYGSFPDQQPDYPVMWLNFGETDYPFGQVLDMREVVA